MEIRHKNYIIDINLLQSEVDYCEYKNYIQCDSSTIICIKVKDLVSDTITKALLNSDGATIQPYKESYLIYESNIIICIGSEIYSLDIPTLNINWQTTCDVACCFTIQEYFGDYLIHGELNITRVNQTGKIVWQFSGMDIFVNLDGEDEFIVTEEGNIIATDFLGNKYYLDPNGNYPQTQKNNILKDIAQGISHLVYPKLCEGCSKPLLAEEEVLCLNCNIYNLPRTAYHHIAENETAMRFAGRFPFQKATSLAYFTPNGLLQHLLHSLKYEDKKHIGYYLGKQLGYDLLQTNWQKGIDLIIPVPLHPKKEALRGFNQSQLIATGISDVLHIPVEAQTLKRNRFTDSQTQKTREERIINMQDAFQISNTANIEGKHILLIDDVLTTGATLESCALALLKAKDVTISIATIGIAN